MGGIEELVNDAEEDEVDEMSNKLGVEDREELERLDDRISDIHELLVKIDKQLEETKDKLRTHENAISELQDRTEDRMTNNNKEDDGLKF